MCVCVCVCQSTSAPARPNRASATIKQGVCPPQGGPLPGLLTPSRQRSLRRRQDPRRWGRGPCFFEKVSKVSEWPSIYYISRICTTYAESTSEIQAKYSGKVVRVEATAPRKKMENIVVVLSELYVCVCMCV